MSTFATLLFLLVLGISNTKCSPAAKPVTMTINTMQAQRAINTNIEIICRSDKLLVGCNFKIWFTEIGGNSNINKDYPLIDFSLGTKSENIDQSKHTSSGNSLYKAEYSGRGLDQNECGTVFTPLNQGRYLVGCRGRAKDGGWGYDFMSLNVIYGLSSTEDKDGREETTTVVKPNENAIVSYKVNAYHVLRACTFFLPTNRGGPVSVDKPQSKSSSPGIYQAEHNDQQCRLTLMNVTEKDNGPLWYSVTSNSSSQPNYQNQYFKAIVVAKAPTSENISFERKDNKAPYTEGEELKATCTASNSRPVANISWLFGSEVIRNDTDDDNTDRAWSWPWDDRSITQTVTRRLSSSDNGKILSCKVQHLALNGYVGKTIQIQVTGRASASSSAQNPITVTATNKPPVTKPDQVSDAAEANAQTHSPIVTANTDGMAPEGSSSRSNTSDTLNASTINIVIGVSCLILALVVVAVFIYAKVTRNCCFKPTGAVHDSTPTSKDQRKTEKPVVQPAKLPGKPRAKSPERAAAGMEMAPKRIAGKTEEAVVYAEISGGSGTATGRAKISMPEETTYAELSFN